MHYITSEYIFFQLQKLLEYEIPIEHWVGLEYRIIRPTIKPFLSFLEAIVISSFLGGRGILPECLLVLRGKGSLNLVNAC